jgi:hypothetical protein
VSVLGRLQYLRRVFAAYCLPGRSQLSFWHEIPDLHPGITPTVLGPYYMAFSSKADYGGPFDAQGIPQLDYRGSLGCQYNPIAIAQYGLGNYNAFKNTDDPERRRKFLLAADWLAEHLEINPAGLSVWNHHFNWEYRTPLRAPWFSGLAQGQGLSLLVRAHRETGAANYRDAARRAFEPFTRTLQEGGVMYRDEDNRTWIEEYIVHPPTHILNGFLWGSWGLYDFWLSTGDHAAKSLWLESVATVKDVLPTYDTGFWSLYEHSGTKLRMVASPFYHALHIVQLRVMHRLTGDLLFLETAERWERYRASFPKRTRAWIQKALFKLCYY